MKVQNNNAMSAAIEQEQKIFQEALEQKSPRELELFLEQACGGNLALRTGVVKLLTAHARAEQFFGGISELLRGEDPAPPKKSDANGSPRAVPEERVGTLIGYYKIVEKL